MSLTREEIMSYVDDTIAIVDGVVERFGQTLSVADWADAVSETISELETESGFLADVRGAVEDDVIPEIIEDGATTLEARYAELEGELDDEDADAEVTSKYLEGFQAAIDYLREQYI